MGLEALDVQISYITYGPHNIREALIIPALKAATCYKRSVGFFSTSVFETILDGVISLAHRKGQIQIITSPELSSEDIEAISLGYKARNSVYTSAFLQNFEQVLYDLSDEKLQITVELIVNKILDIRIVDFAGGNTEAAGLYHDKLGIISDASNNTIVFVGSPNETLNGYQKNYEKVRVFKSWEPGQNAYVIDEVKEFDRLWEGKNSYLKTYSFQDALIAHVLKVKDAREAAKKAKGPITLRKYQNDAINAWINNGYHGFFVMATGTGKTWTAIYASDALRKKHACMIVIAAPYKHLVKQWSEDVKLCYSDAVIIMVSSENPHWPNQLSDAIIKQRIYKDTQIVVITTITSFYKDRFEKTINKSRQEKLLIVDEAHRFTQRPETLHSVYKYMLGLSATPFSGKNAEKGMELMNFFGGQVFSLPIEEALEKKYLVPYYYYPIIVYTTEKEEHDFQQKSIQIAACFRNGKCIDPDGLVKHLRARLRILSMAQAKLDQIDAFIDQINERDHFIVYCGDGHLFDVNDEEIRHIQFVKRHLAEHGFTVSQFTASENMAERMDLIKAFNMGGIDVLAAIRCLDEGVNIPSIKGALILSSNNDYREFVQRRGRILRTYEGKTFANIYDVVVLPSGNTPKIAEIELRRYFEYARLATNGDSLMDELSRLAAEFGLDIDDLAMSFTEESEAILDD